MEPSWRLLLQQMWELEFSFEEPLDFNGGNRPWKNFRRILIVILIV